MLSKQLLLCCNHLLATSFLYLSFFDPLHMLHDDLQTHLIASNGATYDCVSMIVAAETTTDDNRNHYETLGVKKDATKHEIHRAFRQLAKKYHPDKNKDKGASEEFMKIFKAYETLSDEKKRKDYDNQLNGQAYGFNGWQTTTPSSMSDFDINEFFKQYEDQFMRHTNFHGEANSNHHHQHHHNAHHQKFQFHGVDLDDLFHDIDQDEFSSFHQLFDHHNQHNHNHYGQHHNHHQQHSMNDHFGDGDSYFGNLFPSQIHDTLHNFQHSHIHYSGNLGAGVGAAGHQSAGYSCKTITKQMNGMVMTQTSCS